MTPLRQPTAILSASNCLSMEFSRLLCDDGYSGGCPAGAGKSQASRGVDGWTAAGLDAASRMRQESRVTQLMQFFDLSEDQIGESLPPTVQSMSDSEWRGARTDIAESWKGIKGYFRTEQEIMSLMALLGPQR